MRRALLAAVFALGLAPSAHAQEVPLDRVVVRFIAPETGGMRSPRFIFERVLAFEARLEALADPDRAAGSNVSSCRPRDQAHCAVAASRFANTAVRKSLMNCASKASAIRRAMVVLPVPGGPHRMQLCGWPDSKAMRNGMPSPSRCCWPTTSASACGRSRSASGTCGWPRVDGERVAMMPILETPVGPDVPQGCS